MGTSISQGSPATPNWRAVAAGYRSGNIRPERVVRELWRAAQSDAEFDWAELLATPIIFTCLHVAVESEGAAQAASRAAREIVLSRQISLATDVARRAVVQSFNAEDRAQGFAEALFAEASSYLVSRDLPAFVGRGGRCRTVGDSVGFKETMRERVTDVVRGLGPPPRDGAQEAWQRYVALALEELTRARA